MCSSFKDHPALRFWERGNYEYSCSVNCKWCQMPLLFPMLTAVAGGRKKKNHITCILNNFKDLLFPTFWMLTDKWMKHLCAWSSGFGCTCVRLIPKWQLNRPIFHHTVMWKGWSTCQKQREKRVGGHQTISWLSLILAHASQWPGDTVPSRQWSLEPPPACALLSLRRVLMEEGRRHTASPCRALSRARALKERKPQYHLNGFSCII